MLGVGVIRDYGRILASTVSNLNRRQTMPVAGKTGPREEKFKYPPYSETSNPSEVQLW